MRVLNNSNVMKQIFTTTTIIIIFLCITVYAEELDPKRFFGKTFENYLDNTIKNRSDFNWYITVSKGLSLPKNQFKYGDNNSYSFTRKSNTNWSCQ